MKKIARKKKPQKNPPIASGEHIRIAPLYFPKPSVSIDDLARAKRAPAEDNDDDLFAGKPSVAPSNAHLVYNNGPLIPNVQVYTIFWGKKWGTTQGAALIPKLNAFFTAILVSPLMTQLGEYSVPGQTIGNGSFVGTKTISVKAPVRSITDSAIQAQLTQWIAAGTVPKPNANTLYFIYLDPGIRSIMGGSSSCTGYCGYHNHTGSVYYAVMPYPSCTGCLGGMQVFDALTGTSSHELCEAITDPVPGSGWYDNANGEIGDICAWNFKQVAGYNVQLEWSNAANKCV